MVWIDKMMKLRVLIIALLLTLIMPPLAVLGSDISGAQYYGIITVSNNSTATENVSTTCTINTQALIDGGYLNSTANNTVLRNSSGADIPFMPGYGGNPWMMRVPSIGADSYLTYILYTASSSGGEIRYFPGTGGMTTSDNASLELSNNFTIEQSGYSDTSSGSDKNLVYKEDAFRTYVSASGEITSEIGAHNYCPYSSTSDGWMRVANADYNTAWAATTTEFLYDTTTTVEPGQHFSGGNYWCKRAFFYFDTSDIPDDATIISATLKLYCSSKTYVLIDFDVTVQSGQPTYPHDPMVGDDYNKANYSGDGGSLNTADISEEQYADITLNEAGRGWINKTGTTKLTIRSSRDIAGTTPTGGEYINFYTSEETGTDKDPKLEIVTDPLKVTATGVSNGKHTIKTTADGTNLKIYVDDVEKDSTALSDASVPDNANGWTFFQNDVMPYMEYHKITVGGTLKQHIVYEYDTTFNDLTEYNNDATPTFRTTSSDVDVGAELTGFLPVAEAKAPAYALGETSPFISSTPDITSTFTTTPPTGTFPLAGVIKAIADATDTPAQLPLLVIACFIILAVSLTVSATMRRYGSGSVFVKILVIAATMGVFIALANFGIDFWMLVVFLIIACALAMASKQLGWA